MSKKSRLRRARQHRLIGFICLIVSIALLALAISLYCFYQRHFLPRTFFNQQDLGNLNDFEASNFLQCEQQIDQNLVIVLTAGDFQTATTARELNLQYDFAQMIQKERNRQNAFSPLTILRYALQGQNRTITPILNYNSDFLTQLVNGLALWYDQEGVPGTVTAKIINGKKQLELDLGRDKRTIDQQATIDLLLSSLPTVHSFQAVTTVEPIAYTASQAAYLKTEGEKLLGKEINFSTDQINNFTVTLEDEQLVPFLEATSAAQVAIMSAIDTELTALISREPQEPVFVYDDATATVTDFVPPADGLTFDAAAFWELVKAELPQLLTTETTTLELDLPLAAVPPSAQLKDLNQLGISDRLGFGESYYAHSIAGRVHNVAITAERINNTLVAPGKEFSFNQTLGEVSARTGYQNGYVIQGGRSVLAPGGGVCQVSTTLFRALLDSGLKITLRKPHAYRVSYYELNNDPGFDATVYSGNIDLRFINDTNHYVLIHTEADSTNTYMNVTLWGTDDGRRTEITDYQKYNYTSIPATQYIVDLSKPSGYREQIDWAIGGLSTVFTHTIYNADNTIRSQTKYPSTYQAWSAKFIVGP